MLLEDMFKNTWQNHPDYGALRISLEQVVQIANFINQQKKNMRKLKS